LFKLLLLLAFGFCSSWGSQGNYGGITIGGKDCMVEKEGEKQ
jgi:hypothetical protein